VAVGITVKKAVEKNITQSKAVSYFILMKKANKTNKK
jgi:hypothetical protein